MIGSRPSHHDDSIPDVPSGIRMWHSSIVRMIIQRTIMQTMVFMGTMRRSSRSFISGRIMELIGTLRPFIEKRRGRSTGLNGSTTER